MGNTKQGQTEDQVETKEDPTAVLAGRGANTEANVASPLENDRGGLRSQGEVALVKKDKASRFSNAYMRSQAAAPVGTREIPKPAESKPALAKTHAAAGWNAQAAQGGSRSAPNASDLDATLPEAIHANTSPVVKPEKGPAKANVAKTAPNTAPKAEGKTAEPATVGVPKTGPDAQTGAPVISLKVAVKMDAATLVMNPKSEAKLDDASAATSPKTDVKTAKAATVVASKSDVKANKAAPIAPKSDAKREKPAAAIRPKIEIKKDKGSPTKGSPPTDHAAKGAPASASQVEVKSDKKTGQATQAAANAHKAKPVPAEAPAAPEPSVDGEAEPDLEIPSADDDAPAGMDLSDAKADDLQDTTERAKQTGSLSERRHRRTRELKTHHDAAAENRP